MAKPENICQRKFPRGSSSSFFVAYEIYIKTVSTENSSNYTKKKNSKHVNSLNTVKKCLSHLQLALKLTPREKNEFEVINILVKTDFSRSSNKTTRILSIFTRFYINFLENALEFNRGVTYINELQ